MGIKIDLYGNKVLFLFLQSERMIEDIFCSISLVQGQLHVIGEHMTLLKSPIRNRSKFVKMVFFVKMHGILKGECKR